LLNGFAGGRYSSHELQPAVRILSDSKNRWGFRSWLPYGNTFRRLTNGWLPRSRLQYRLCLPLFMVTLRCQSPKCQKWLWNLC